MSADTPANRTEQRLKRGCLYPLIAMYLPLLVLTIIFMYRGTNEIAQENGLGTFFDGIGNTYVGLLFAGATFIWCIIAWPIFGSSKTRSLFPSFMFPLIPFLMLALLLLSIWFVVIV